MQFSTYQLVLFTTATTPDALPMAELQKGLQDLGLLGADLGAGYYACGEQFLSLLCFLGCSPHIELEPREQGSFCYVQLPQQDTAIQDLQLIRKAPQQCTTWLVIGDIHEAEAVPDTALLDHLEQLSGSRWRYGYRR